MRNPLAITCALLALVCLPAGRKAFASCGQAQCSLDSNLNSTELAAQEVRFDLVTEYIEQDQPWVGYHSVDVGAIPRDDHNEVSTTNLTWKFRAEVALTERFAIAIMLPLLHREHEHLAVPGAEEGAESSAHHARHGDASHAEEEIGIGDANGTPERWDFTRLGDIQLTASYAILRAARREDVSLHLIAGLKVPSGDTGVRNDAGEEAEITLQPGTGSVDPIFGLALQKSFALWRPDLLLPLAASVQVRTEGSDGKFGYRPGTEVITSLATDYPLTPHLHALGQINFRYRDRDHVGDAPGVHQEDTGGEMLALSPGLRFDLTERAALYSYVQVPVLQRVNGIQLVSRWNLLAGLTYRLPL